MKRSKLTSREIWMLAFLAVLLVGIIYYLGFYMPMQQEMLRISTESAEADTMIDESLHKASDMKKMETELEVILAQPKDKITEIAPYDNKEVVLANLNGILSRTLEYSLSFEDPVVGTDGTVRRNISMNFSCETYDAAKAVIQDLTRSKWRCLVTDCSLAADESKYKEMLAEDEDGDGDLEYEEVKGNLMVHPVDVDMTICFFESNKLDRNPAISR